MLFGNKKSLCESKIKLQKTLSFSFMSQSKPTSPKSVKCVLCHTGVRKVLKSVTYYLNGPKSEPIFSPFLHAIINCSINNSKINEVFNKSMFHFEQIFSL